MDLKKIAKLAITEDAAGDTDGAVSSAPKNPDFEKKHPRGNPNHKGQFRKSEKTLAKLDEADASIEKEAATASAEIDHSDSPIQGGKWIRGGSVSVMEDGLSIEKNEAGEVEIVRNFGTDDPDEKMTVSLFGDGSLAEIACSSKDDDGDEVSTRIMYDYGDDKKVWKTERLKNGHRVADAPMKSESELRDKASNLIAHAKSCHPDLMKTVKPIRVIKAVEDGHGKFDLQKFVDYLEGKEG